MKKYLNLLSNLGTCSPEIYLYWGVQLLRYILPPAICSAVWRHKQNRSEILKTGLCTAQSYTTDSPLVCTLYKPALPGSNQVNVYFSFQFNGISFIRTKIKIENVHLSLSLMSSSEALMSSSSFGITWPYGTKMSESLLKLKG